MLRLGSLAPGGPLQSPTLPALQTRFPGHKGRRQASARARGDATPEHPPPTWQWQVAGVRRAPTPTLRLELSNAPAPPPSPPEARPLSNEEPLESGAAPSLGESVASRAQLTPVHADAGGTLSSALAPKAGSFWGLEEHQPGGTLLGTSSGGSPAGSHLPPESQSSHQVLSLCFCFCLFCNPWGWWPNYFC